MPPSKPRDDAGSSETAQKRPEQKSRPKKELGRSAADFLPDKINLKNLRESSRDCKGCDLYKDATQTVFGEGSAKARIMLIGEQPGDVEDREGHPFVGPAGKLLHKALTQAGIDETDCYFTNAVKHFKYEWKGKRRLHAKPRRIEVMACMPWLESEIAALKPDIVVCLGATASQALFGAKFRLTEHRGEFLQSDLAKYVVATVHPSSILRARDDQTRRAEMDAFVDDLRRIGELL